MVLIIFDIDGTLVYSDRRDSRSFAATYELLYRRPFPTLDWHNFPHVTDTILFGTAIREHFRREHSEAEVEYFQQFYLARLAENRRLRPHFYQEIPGARRTFERLQADERFVLGVGTGGWQRPARVKLSHVGIPTEGLLLSGADGKISREEILGEVIDAARGRYGDLSRIVYVGDAQWDVTTTRNMQLNFIGIRRQRDFDYLTGAGATHVLPDYERYEDFLSAVFESAPPRAEKNGRGETIPH